MLGHVLTSATRAPSVRSNSMLISHPMNPDDQSVVGEMRRLSAQRKGLSGKPDQRGVFDDLMNSRPAAAGVRYEAASVGGVSGWWCRLPDARRDAVLLFFHGGGYAVGSALAYRNFAGQIAAHTGLDVLVPEYRLAPEHPFPAATTDAAKVYAALAQQYAAVVVAGDSAGGGLALSLLGSRPEIAPRAVVALSPWTDLTLTSESLQTRADAELYLTRDGLRAAAGRYLNEHAAHDPRVSPLFGDLSSLPPVSIHVGDAEVLLDDSILYGERHPSCTVHVWEGMPHVFMSCVDTLRAAKLALEEVGTFVREQLEQRGKQPRSSLSEPVRERQTG